MVLSATIFAPASAQGRAGVTVIRISGDNARRVFDLCRPQQLPAARFASLREIHHPRSDALIDKALVIWFPAPHSFTGEDVVELHIHGGRAVLGAVIECLGLFPDFRLAEAGEFTRRAFENGKLDLTEAEALADLVNADTEAQRRQAIRQLDGKLGKLYEAWRERLTNTLAYIEASIDFSDEELPADMEQKQIAALSNLVREITQHLDDNRRGEQLREGFEIAILGPPNAGKSSLLNALTKRETAIVSSIAGTTRDIIEAHLDLNGYPIVLADTAGLRESKDILENEGIKRALTRAEKADFKLLVFDGENWPQLDETTKKLIDKNAVAIVNKTDLISKIPQNSKFHFISTKTGEGVKELLEKIVERIDRRFVNNATPPLTRERHRVALEECAQHLQRTQAAKEPELRAEDVRLASRALGRITGRVDVEDLLDVIFRDFCVGK